MTPLTIRELTPEQRERDARIAVAMGWTAVEFRWWDRGKSIGDYTGFPSDYAFDWNLAKTLETLSGEPHLPRPSVIPCFHASEDARRSLLEWLAKQGRPMQMVFMSHVFEQVGIDRFEAPDVSDYMAVILATPDQVARAADATLRGEGEK